MASSVTVPLWLALALAILALIALIDRFFGLALGWWLRRRANRAIDELNQRLKIPPFKLARRRPFGRGDARNAARRTLAAELG